MANPVFQALGGANNQPNMLQQFQQFMQQMKGKDPSAVLNQLVQSGRVSQQQLDYAQRQAQQMQGLFNGMRGMFGS